MGWIGRELGFKISVYTYLPIYLPMGYDLPVNIFIHLHLSLSILEGEQASSMYRAVKLLLYSPVRSIKYTHSLSEIYTQLTRLSSTVRTIIYLHISSSFSPLFSSSLLLSFLFVLSLPLSPPPSNLHACSTHYKTNKQTNQPTT